MKNDDNIRRLNEMFKENVKMTDEESKAMLAVLCKPGVGEIFAKALAAGLTRSELSEEELQEIRDRAENDTEAQEQYQKLLASLEDK